MADLANTDAEECVAALRAMKVTHLLFVRHANAAPLNADAPRRAVNAHGWKMDDQRRGLTSKGNEQCESAKSWFEELPVKFVMVTSPARRATETAVGMGYKALSNGLTLPLLMVEALHPAGQEETCETLFETRGYGPLRGFHEAEGGEAAFNVYAQRVCKEMKEKLMANVNEMTAVNTEGVKAITLGSSMQVNYCAVFGHAVFLNVVALRLAQAAKAAEADMILDVDLGETQGLLVPIADGTSDAVQHKKA